MKNYRKSSISYNIFTNNLYIKIMKLFCSYLIQNKWKKLENKNKLKNSQI